MIDYTTEIEMSTPDNARFDAQLPKEQKEFFKRAASLGGFRNLTEFIISSAQEKADSIVEERQRILTSEQDKELFFHAILNPKKPNSKLKKAASRYSEAISL